MTARRRTRDAARPPTPGRAPSTGALGIWLWVSLLVAVAVWSYSNSFRGAFVGDDLAAIVQNPHLRSLWPPSIPLTAPKETTLAGRPVVSSPGRSSSTCHPS